MIGKKQWAVGDGYMNRTANGAFESHEAICVLNVSGEKAEIQITVLFEDREPIAGFKEYCENNRAKHIRLDRISNENGEKIPYGIPYALLIESNTDIVVQHSRLDVSQAEMALMSTIAYSN